ncbi:unnamed protein product [Lasius platythorax]|uniref:Uncharacterized protein n=1 Tax=Lasius platythorax TaxID=488582 RepID=A0AAV2NTS8_9HYME
MGDKPQHRRTWCRAARVEAIRRLNLQGIQERVAQMIDADNNNMISDSDTEYSNDNFGDVNDSSDVNSEEQHFGLHDALVNHDFDERNEICNDGSTGNEVANIIIENEENMGINHVNIENDLVVNDAQINAYVLRNVKEWGRRGVTGQKINGLLRILRVVFPQVPKDYRSLLSTPRNTPVKDIENGYL